MKPKAILSWSGGKDCMLALWHARERFDIVALLTTVTIGFDRISMHGVRIALLHQQANRLGIQPSIIEIPKNCPNGLYEEATKDYWEQVQEQGIQTIIFGDLFLQDIRNYRENLFGRDACIFPLWRRPTSEVAREFLDLGFRAVLCCVDTTVLPAEFAGRKFDEELLRDLPASVDPCGENGEFHTFVYAGPLFRTPIALQRGERVLRQRERWSYCDLLPIE